MVLENWNITTVWWLRRTAYDRLTNHRTMGVFVLSAVWHGFYGGYYLTFFTSQLFVEAARAVRRTLREKFQKTPLASRAYDVITALTTALFLVYATIPFALLDLWAGIRFWRSMYFFGHVMAILALVICRRKSSQSKPSIEKTKSTDTNQNGVAWTDKTKSQ
ncbi:Membrane-bound O-acyltransferase domain-containing protein 2 [Exaiptasia diaphana]|nr:Membrane-bound O-acyltransferase domain-containing protein 2 [Exaiptasia diaphana]